MTVSSGRNVQGSLRTLESNSSRTLRERSTWVLAATSALAMSRMPVTSQIFS